MLVLEGSNNGVLVVIVNWGDEDTLGECVAAVFPGESCDCMFSGLKERGDDVRSNGAPSLGVFVSLVAYAVMYGDLLTPTIATLSMAFWKPVG